ncbi:hypothetical protein QBC41DRAFT_313835 [Cercophora samala]|uniref:WKF domain-containing protein n=1 Tax=Cercophora samala TaxID=330535 RepID=A0AA39ZK02_9PEZI|nr:hypothetical protein QBC41DRAFT_313835 [Cercophora samala]
MSARVPAWKRLGLKLKGASDESPAPSSSGPNASSNSQVTGSPASALKRKQPPYQSTANSYNTNSYNGNSYAQTPNKRFRADEQTPGSQRKSVSFTADTKKTSVEPAKKKAKKKKTKKPAQPVAKPETNLEPSLDYLRQWHTARDSWKFNKNHQTLLIKYLFDGDKIPSDDIPVFYQYISDLKGGVRTRLRETAVEIKKKDMEQGVSAFPADTKDKATKQTQYEEVISRFLEDLQQHQKQLQSAGTNANGKRPLEEVQYVIRTVDPLVKQRALRRIRAEIVAVELASDSEESTTTSTAAASTTTSSSSSSSGQENAAADKRTRSDDDSQQPAKKRRLRKVRNMSDDESSSSSESESDSSDDDDDGEDEKMADAPNGNGKEDEETSSSSSSSSESSSEDDSDDEEEGGDGSDSDSSESSESSESDSD